MSLIASMSLFTICALAGAAGWLYLLLFRDGFWRADQRLGQAPAPAAWPAVVVVIPARDEVEYVAAAITSLLAQDYPGRLHVVLVDDNSTDGTSDAARAAGRKAGANDRLEVIAGAPLAAGWTGKMWALSQGVAAAEKTVPEAGFLLFTDADITHESGSLRRLVAKAEAEKRDLVSLMVRLHCQEPAERLLIPAFVFFFQMLFPFPAVNDPKRRLAAAAGGCMLVRRQALARAGGIAAVKNELIDDCALARRIKAGGPIWLGLTQDSHSIRPYDGVSGIWDMVARTAFTQLRHSALLLSGAVIGLWMIFLAPPIAAVWGALAGDAAACIAGLVGWIAMAAAYRPTLRLYDQPAGEGLYLPLAAFLYTSMTVASAVRHWRGRGGDWKGRTYPDV